MHPKHKRQNLADGLQSVFRGNNDADNVSILSTLIKYYIGIKYSFTVVVGLGFFRKGKTKDKVFIYYMEVRPAGPSDLTIKDFQINLQSMQKIYVCFPAGKFLQFEILTEQYPGISGFFVVSNSQMIGEIKYYDLKLLLQFIFHVGYQQIPIEFLDKIPPEFDVISSR